MIVAKLPLFPVHSAVIGLEGNMILKNTRKMFTGVSYRRRAHLKGTSWNHLFVSLLFHYSQRRPMCSNIFLSSAASVVAVTNFNAAWNII